jgi:serine/threonine protein kinase
MEYCGAGSASDLMNSTEQTFSEEEIAAVCGCVLKGLQYLHSKHNIHRDLKAGNVLLSHEGNAKLGNL